MTAKARPALVLNIPHADEDRVLFVLIGHTMTLHQSSHEVVIDVPFLNKGAFLVQAPQIITKKQAFLYKRGTLNPEQMQMIEKGVCRALGINPASWTQEATDPLKSKPFEQEQPEPQ
jgi:hypothetical protein